MYAQKAHFGDVKRDRVYSGDGAESFCYPVNRDSCGSFRDALGNGVCTVADGRERRNQKARGVQSALQARLEKVDTRLGELNVKTFGVP